MTEKVGSGRLSIRFKTTSSQVTALSDFSYVSKAETRTNGSWSDRTQAVPWQIKPIIENSLYPWQEDVENSHLWPDARKINVLVNPDGGMGKSTYCAWLVFTERGVVVPPFSNAEQLKQAAHMLLINKPRQKLIVDLPRGLTFIPDYQRNGLSVYTPTIYK